MWPSTAKWLNDLKPVSISSPKKIAVSLRHYSTLRASSGDRWGQRESATTDDESDDVMQALIRDIQLARHNMRWCFISGSPAAWRTRWLNHYGRCATRHSLPIDARLRRECAFFRSPWPELMRNAGIEVVEP